MGYRKSQVITGEEMIGALEHLLPDTWIVYRKDNMVYTGNPSYIIDVLPDEVTLQDNFEIWLPDKDDDYNPNDFDLS